MIRLGLLLLGCAILHAQQQGGLQEFMDQTKEDYKMLGMIIQSFRSNGTILKGHIGVRNADDPTPIEENDKFMLGDAGRSITAMLAARIVEKGLLTWNSTIGEVLVDSVDVGSLLAKSTLLDLLVHSGQIMDVDNVMSREEFMDWYDQVWVASNWDDAEENVQQRLEMTKYFVANCKDINDDAKCDYCNIEEDGDTHCTEQYSLFTYSVAVAMLEKLTGKPFEVLLDEEVFGPLGITDCGVGPNTLDPSLPPSQPWSHFSGPWGVYNIPLVPGNQTGMPSSMAPDTGIHCSMNAWQTFLSAHITRDESYLSQDTWELLVTPRQDFGSDIAYAPGFLVESSNPFLGKTLYHPSTDSKYFAEFFLKPGSDFGIVLAVNSNMQGGMRQMVGMEKILKFVENHIYQNFGISFDIEKMKTLQSLV